jgi:hypothetical protein
MEILMETYNNSKSNRSCIVVLNQANITGFLNNHENSNGKMRIDYSKLLEQAANGRNLIGALCVSQCDSQVMGLKPQDYKKKNRKFLYSLQAFGWTPLEVEYNSLTQDVTQVTQSVYNAVCEMLLDSEGNPKYDLANLDLIFITGSSLWSTVIAPFSENGLAIEVLYPRKSTSSALYSQFVFRDLYPFIVASNTEVMSRRLEALANKTTRI